MDEAERAAVVERALMMSASDGDPQHQPVPARRYHTQKEVPLRQRMVVPLAIAASFVAMRFVLSSLLRRAGPLEFRTASAARQSRAILTIMSTVNAVLTCIPFPLELPSYLVKGRTYPDPYTTVDPATGRIPVAESAVEVKRSKFLNGMGMNIFFGYVMGDLVGILPDAAKYPAEVFHHLVGIAIGVTGLRGFEQSYPFMGPFFFAEASTVLLNLLWFLREFPKASAQAANAVGIGALVRWAKGPAADPAQVLRDSVVPYLFAATFTLVRVVNYPRMLWALRTAKVRMMPDDDSNDAARDTNVLEVIVGKAGTAAMALLTLLQFYWFGLIMKKLVAR